MRTALFKGYFDAIFIERMPIIEEFFYGGVFGEVFLIRFCWSALIGVFR